MQWEAVDKVKDELEAWLLARSQEVDKIGQRPAKLHVEAAQMEITHLQVGCNNLKILLAFVVADG